MDQNTKMFQNLYTSKQTNRRDRHTRAQTDFASPRRGRSSHRTACIQPFMLWITCLHLYISVGWSVEHTMTSPDTTILSSLPILQSWLTQLQSRGYYNPGHSTILQSWLTGSRRCGPGFSQCCRQRKCVWSRPPRVASPPCRKHVRRERKVGHDSRVRVSATLEVKVRIIWE